MATEAKVTVVSLIPRMVNESMPHIYPDRYVIQAANEGDFEILVIGNARDLVYASEGRHIERSVPAMEVAEALINSAVNSCLGIGENSRPGLFVVEGELTKEQVKSKHGGKLMSAKIQQISWFRTLVARADEDWQKFHTHGMIPAITRDAARLLKLQREWLFEDAAEGPSICPACGKVLPNPTVTICAACHTIIRPEEHAKKFGPKTAVA